MRRVKELLTVSALAFAFVALATPVLALAAPNERANAQATEETTEVTTQAADRKAAAQAKLADTKLKVCQKREKNINNVMSRIADRGQKQLDLFSSIATKTETFYLNKGKVLSNYDALLADVMAKKEAAQATVDTVKSTGVTFKCDGTDPKGAVSSFKESLKSEIAALKEYKTSVKNFIVGVKSVQGSTTSTENSTGENE